MIDLKKILPVIAIVLLIVSLVFYVANYSYTENSEVPFYVAWVIHIHQPLYNENGSLVDLLNSPNAPDWLPNVWISRVDIYSKWIPWVASNMTGDEALHVSITGTLIQQLNELEAKKWNNCLYCGWEKEWVKAASLKTSLGLSRLRILYTGYYHPIFPLIQRSGLIEDFIEQIKKHNETTTALFHDVKGRGFFPIEESFTPEMIPLLAKLGIEWTVVDSEHLLRATIGYDSPYDPKPNPYDVRNPDPRDWDWGVSPQLVFCPHVIEYNGSETVVFIRYKHMSQAVMSGTNVDYLINQIKHFQQYNTDPKRPFIMVIVHDGENGWPLSNGGRDYYENYLLAFLNRIRSDPSLSFIKVIGLDEYLAKVYDPRNDTEYPYAKVWVEPGSWGTMATWGDPDFGMWNWKNIDAVDQVRWAKYIEAVNYYLTAEKVVDNNQEYIDDLINAFNELLKGETSCYWYWDGSEWWDRKAIVLFERSISYSRNILEALNASDHVAPTIRYGWREPYNPVDSLDIYIQVYDLWGVDNVKAYLYLNGTLVDTTYAEPLSINNFYKITFTLQQPGLYYVLVEASDIYGNKAVYTMIPPFITITATGSIEPFIIDGKPDLANPVYVNENNTFVKTLWAVYTMDNYLYVATEPAPTGYDVFVFVSLDPWSGPKKAPWLKNGSVYGYVLYLGNEGDNKWCGWFRYTDKYDELLSLNPPIASCYCGEVLEGYIKLDHVLGSNLSDQLYVTVAVYNTSNYGGLVEVLKTSIKNESVIEPQDYIVINKTNVVIRINITVTTFSLTIPPVRPTSSPGYTPTIIIGLPGSTTKTVYKTTTTTVNNTITMYYVKTTTVERATGTFTDQLWFYILIIGLAVVLVVLFISLRRRS